MKYYLDCEFNGLGGQLLSMALIREDGQSFYYVTSNVPNRLDPWVKANVMPILFHCPLGPVGTSTPEMARGALERFLLGDQEPIIITDWPDDIKYFAEFVITGPGTMIRVPSLRFEMLRVDAYPTTLPNAIQHNAWWDAMALKHLLESRP